jgi:hypothetical protein
MLLTLQYGITLPILPHGTYGTMSWYPHTFKVASANEQQGTVEPSKPFEESQDGEPQP